MAHGNGRIYIDPSGSPILGVSIADIQAVLGTASHNDIGGLIANGNINKWAKHKPFRNSAPGFTLYRTQSTPEARCPDKMTQMLAANYGLVLPRYNANDFKTHYSDVWTYVRPRGLAQNEFFRFIDFDGYNHNPYPMMGPVSFNGIYAGYYTIFNGYLSTPRTQYVYPGDLITFYLQCREEPGDGTGLLFPYDFYPGQANENPDDISQYYIGIAILSNGGTKLWVITGDQMLSHITSGDTEAYLSVNVPNSITSGTGAKIIPMLASHQYSSWDDAPGQGYFLGLNGAYLTRDIGSASQKISIGVTITYSNGNATMAFTITNNTSSNVLLKNLVAFISSAESFYNEGDSDHHPPTTGGYGVRDYLYDHWNATAAENLPPFSAMGLSNPPNIYLSDWISGLTPPAYLVGVGYNAYPDFRDNNQNTDKSTLTVGQTVSWTKVMNIGTDDGCGYYSDGVFVSVCAFVNMSAYVEEFSD